MKADKVENWFVVEGDNALLKSVEKQIKWSRNKNSTLLDYQKDQLLKALSFVRNFDTAIDAGANYGLMSFHLSPRFKKIYAFEIESKVRDCLRRNLDRFGLNNVTVQEYGLGDVEKSVALRYSKNSFATQIDPNTESGDYTIKTLDSLGLSSCDFIKIDCEGYEPHIIRGAETTIKQFRPVVLMEDKNLSEIYGEDGQSSVSILESWGYKKVVQFKKDCIMCYDR